MQEHICKTNTEIMITTSKSSRNETAAVKSVTIWSGMVRWQRGWLSWPEALLKSFPVLIPEIAGPFPVAFFLYDADSRPRMAWEKQRKVYRKLSLLTIHLSFCSPYAALHLHSPKSGTQPRSR